MRALLSLRNSEVIFDAVMKSFEAHTPKPYLVPLCSFFPDLDSAQIMEIPVGDWCRSVACSPCDRYVLAGGGHNVVVADSITGVALKKLEGHSGRVQCVRFVAGSQTIVSASEDKTIAVWEWESPTRS